MQRPISLLLLAALAVNAVPQLLKFQEAYPSNSSASSSPQYPDYPYFNSSTNPIPPGSIIQCENTLDKSLNYSATGYFTLNDVEAALPPFCTSTYFFQLPDPDHAFLGIGGYLNDLAIIIQTFNNTGYNDGSGVFDYSNFTGDCANAFLSLITQCLEVSPSTPDYADAPQRGGSLFWRNLQFSLRYNGALGLPLPTPATGGYVEVNWTAPITIETPILVSPIVSGVFVATVTTLASTTTLPPVNGQSGVVEPVYAVGLTTVSLSVPSSRLTQSPSAPSSSTTNI